MSFKYTNLPAPTFIEGFLQAKNLSTAGYDAAVDLAKDQFLVTEQIKEYAADVEKSNMYIGSDVERVLAVGVGHIKMGIAKDRAGYKAELAAAVKSVKEQQAMLEGQFGVDVASVKRSVDLKAMQIVTELDEETSTTVSGNEYASAVGLTNLELESSTRVNASEDTFRRSLSDSDYTASVAIADTRATNITTRGETDRTAIVNESTITDQGLRWSYDTEAGGIKSASITEQGLIKEQGLAERQNIRDISAIKVTGIQDMAAAEVLGISNVSADRITMIRDQGDSQVKLSGEYATASAALAVEMGLLEAAFIGVESAARDQAYLAGARADLAVDAKRFEAEAESVRTLALNKTKYITQQAQSEADSKVRIAGIEGAAEVSRAIKEGQNEVQMAILRGSHQLRIAGLKAEASDRIANKQAGNIADMSAIVVQQLYDDANRESAHVSAMSVIDVDRYTQIQSMETAAVVTNAAESIRHTTAMTGLSNEHLGAMGQAQAEYILAASKVGIDSAVNRMLEESRYLAEEAANRAARLNSMTAINLGYIAEQANSSAAKVRMLADESYDNATSIIDAEYQLNIATTGYLQDISTQMAEWNASTTVEVSGFIQNVQFATRELAQYGRVYNNVFRSDSPGGEEIHSTGDPITFPRLDDGPSFYGAEYLVNRIAP